MRILCPCCGERDAREFTYCGDASRVMPALDAEADAWAAYVWGRKNPRGPHEEYWQHAHGCRHWLRVTRNTETHEILSVLLEGPWRARHEAKDPR